MNVEKILTIENVEQMMKVLKKNLNSLTSSDIEANNEYFYDNSHKIKSDPNKQDRNEVDNGESITIRRTRLALSYPEQIVNTATAFIFGKPIKLTLASESTDKNVASFNTFKDCWDNEARMMAYIRKAFRSTCVETRSALQFFIDNDGSLRVKLLSKKEGYDIYRHKDDSGKLDAVIVEYLVDDIIDGKLVENIKVCEIWTKDAKLTYRNSKPYGEPQKNMWGKIMFAYFEQYKSEYDSVKDLIDLQDYSRSQHSEVNTKIGNPALVVYGKLTRKPRQTDDVKIFEVSATNSFEQKTQTGVMQYLEVTGAPESVKLELDNNDRDIFRFTWGDLSRLQDSSFGNLATASIKIMFTPLYIKLAEKQEFYDEMIGRIISMFKKAAAVAKKDANIENLNITFEYGSLIPEDYKSLVDTLAVAVGANLTSIEQAVKLISFNSPTTLSEIEARKQLEASIVKVSSKTEGRTPPNPDGIN